MAILDTSILIDIVRNNANAREAVRKLLGGGETLQYSAVSAMELAAGSPAGIDAKRQELLDTLSCVPMSARIAVKAGMLYRDLRGRGADIGPLDVIIAASAVVLNEPIVTHNAKHFSRVEGLRVITY